MKNKYASNIMQYRRAGVEDGFLSATVIMLLAIENVHEGFVSDDKMPEFCTAVEAEINRLFRNECKSDPNTAAERVTYYVDKLRKKMCMEPIAERR